MKKFLLAVLLLAVLTGCAPDGTEVTNPDDRYIDLIEIIEGYDNFLSSSQYFNIEGELAKIDDGYRFYVTIDNPRIAMYDIEAIAIEKGIDYRLNMAANVGVFETSQYNMVPNQTNPKKGFVEGLILSGVTSSPNTSLYILVQYHNVDYTTVHREFFKLDLAVNEG